MRVTIFGANGTTGSLLTDRCLAAGYEVTALLRRPEKFARRNDVIAVQGSVFDVGDVERALEGADVVLSALGAHSPLRNENVLPRAVPAIIAGMENVGITRLIALGSAGARQDSLKHQPAWRRWLVENILYRTVLKWPVHEQVVQYRLLEASTLDWTMAMPGMLTNGKPRGRYRIDAEALPPNGASIARADVADFMMQQIEGHDWLRSGVYLCY